MKKKAYKTRKGKISVSGNLPRPGQKGPATIVLTQPKRFGIDIADYMQAIRWAENVDYSRRFRLYDLYSDILMDPHLTSVIEKRKNAVLSSVIEFRRDGKPDEKVNEQIRSPWFRRLVSDIIDAKVWGFSLMQFYRRGEWIDYDLVPRKHADPVRRLILRHQTDTTGTSWDEYLDLLFVGSPDDLGLLAKAAIWVIYKRSDVADWAQFAEVFGAPIREYTYPTDDDEARRRALEDADSTGSMAVFVHSTDTHLEFREASNKTGSSDLYDRLCERCNNEISKLFLGNTLTTEASDKGTQALGTVHEKIEDKVAQADRHDVLEVLNYNMTDIFLRMGIDTSAGEFCFPEQKVIEPKTKVEIIAQLKNTFGLPVSDDYLYEEFGIEKPENYEELKKRQEEMKQVATAAVAKAEEADTSEKNDAEKAKETKEAGEPPKEESGKKGGKVSLRGWLQRTLKNWRRDFFGRAPQKDGAVLEW